MFKKISIIFIVAIAIIFGGFVSEANATGLFSRFRRSRRVVRQRVVVERKVVAFPQRVVRIVEVPNLEYRTDAIVVRDGFGRIVDVRRQRVVEINRVRPVRTRKVIVERNVIRRR